MILDDLAAIGRRSKRDRRLAVFGAERCRARVGGGEQRQRRDRYVGYGSGRARPGTASI